MRCYAPSTTTIVALLFAGYLALRHTAGHALAGGLVISIVILVGCGLLVGGLLVVSAATRRRRAAAGDCLTCSHPCQGEVDVSGPAWPHRPLTRASLPLVVVPHQRQADADVGTDVGTASERERVH